MIKALLPAALGAVCLLSTTASRAEPANANLEGFKKTGYVRAAIDARDRKLTGLPPSASVWNDAAYWQILTYCASMHGVQKLRLEHAGQGKPALDEQEGLAKHYYELASAMLQKDRGVTEKAAQEILEPEDAYWTFSFMEQPLNYAPQAMLCRLAEVRSKR